MNPDTPQRGIDHLVLCVSDLEAARARYRALGFTLTPPARHPFGTANSLVQLQGSFLELLAVDDPARIATPPAGGFSFADFNRRFLSRHDGLSMLVFESADARRDQAEFTAKGLRTYPPFDFSRHARLPDGASVTVGFSLAFVTDPRLPMAAFFTCQQHAPEYFWKAAYQQHANGARAVAEVIMVAPDPHALADLFGKLQTPQQVVPWAGGLRVNTARGMITVLSPSAWDARFPGVAPPTTVDGARFAGYALTTPSLAAVSRHLRASGIGVVETADRVQVPATDLFGATLEFRTA